MSISEEMEVRIADLRARADVLKKLIHKDYEELNEQLNQMRNVLEDIKQKRHGRV